MFLYLIHLLRVALTRRSVTIALIFSLALQGVSVGGHLRDMFRWLGLIWPLVWILPFILVWLLMRYEPKWLPREKFRRRLAVFLVFGSLVLSATTAKLTSTAEPKKAREPSSSSASAPAQQKDDAFSRLRSKK